MKRKLLIVNKAQFGYHIDTFYYCKYLPQNYEVSYLCFDEGKEKIKLDNVEVYYCSNKGKYSQRALNFYIFLYRMYFKLKPDLVFIKYFLGCFLMLGFIKRSKMILDIRTGSVSSSQKKRKRRDRVLKFEVKGFKHITVISEGLKERLRLRSSAEVIPLGAIQISDNPKEYDSLKLLYVGTFSNRNIDLTIKAVGKYVREIDNRISYQIVGFGSDDDLKKINAEINKNNLNKIVIYEGMIPVNKLEKYFKTNNVGVAFVPMTSYYDHQPPTKIFEYALSGMVTIATNTSINRTLINQLNGVTCDDSAEDFYLALLKLKKNLKAYKYQHITESLKDFHWKSIVEKKLLVKLEEVVGQ